MKILQSIKSFPWSPLNGVWCGAGAGQQRAVITVLYVYTFYKEYRVILNTDKIDLSTKSTSLFFDIFMESSMLLLQGCVIY